MSTKIKNIARQIIFLITVIFLIPFSAQAAVNWNNGVFENPTGLNNTNELVSSVVNWFLGITSAVVILFLVVGGIIYLTSAGDESRIEQAKKIITYCIIGLFIILISYSVVLTLNSIIFSGVSAPTTVSAPATIVIPAQAPTLPIVPITAPGAAAPVLTTITVSPATATITVGATQTFTASPKDQNGNVITATITWSSSIGGTINNAGLFMAAAAGTTTVTANSGSVNGTATVTITAAVPVLTTITVSPATAIITVGATQTFTASPKDQYGNPIAAAIVWTSNDAVCGSFSVSSDTHSLTYVAGNTQCSNIVFTAASGGKSGSAIGVKITPQVNSMTISPSNPTINAGTAQTFTAFPKDGNNNPVTNAAVIWSVGDSFAGAIVADTTDSKIAVFTAAERYDGSTTITATSGGKSATADVVIIY